MFRKLGYLLQRRAKLLCCPSNFLLCPYFDCVNKWKTFQNYNNFVHTFAQPNLNEYVSQLILK